jgi:YopT peptidase
MEHDIVGHLKKFQACYANIGIRADVAVGHALAAWIGGYNDDACFFDPNYGEFWFRNKQDFFNFFPAFFRRAYKVPPTVYDLSWGVEAWLPK